MKQQTAVEWLIEQYNYYRPGQMPRTTFKKVCEQALQMEKEQIINSYISGDLMEGRANLNDAKQYYNETYDK